MGFNPGLLDSVVKWGGLYGLKAGDAVFDIGTSELYCAQEPAALNRFLSHFGAAGYDGEELAKKADRSLAAELFLRAGLRYQAADISPYEHTLRMDLNSARLPFRHRGRYALVTNTGTSAYVLNQFNVLKVVHEACAVGGLMYHAVPMSGEYNHGFFSYHPRLFRALAGANDYEILAFWGWAADRSTAHYEPLDGWSQRFFMEFNTRHTVQAAWAHILMRKKWKAPCRVPMDGIAWSDSNAR